MEQFFLFQISTSHHAYTTDLYMLAQLKYPIILFEVVCIGPKL